MPKRRKISERIPAHRQGISAKTIVFPLTLVALGGVVLAFVSQREPPQPPPVAEVAESTSTPIPTPRLIPIAEPEPDRPPTRIGSEAPVVEQEPTLSPVTAREFLELERMKKDYNKFSEETIHTETQREVEARLQNYPGRTPELERRLYAEIRPRVAQLFNLIPKISDVVVDEAMNWADENGLDEAERARLMECANTVVSEASRAQNKRQEKGYRIDVESLRPELLAALLREYRGAAQVERAEPMGERALPIGEQAERMGERAERMGEQAERMGEQAETETETVAEPAEAAEGPETAAEDPERARLIAQIEKDIRKRVNAWFKKRSVTNMRCRTCDGTQIVRCSECKGNGRIVFFDPARQVRGYRTCHVCNGRREYPCRDPKDIQGYRNLSIRRAFWDFISPTARGERERKQFYKDVIAGSDLGNRLGRTFVVRSARITRVIVEANSIYVEAEVRWNRERANDSLPPPVAWASTWVRVGGRYYLATESDSEPEQLLPQSE